ncbi:MAG TPA: glycosyltransferase [Opitutaceae bacterium]
MRLSIVIPTWNEVRYLGRTLDSLQGIDAEIVCVDGASNDGTPGLARSFGVTVIRSPRGRGLQLQQGVLATHGEILWFLHADTVVRCDAMDQINQVCVDPRIVGGNFHLLFDGSTRGARFQNRLYPRLARVGIRYGDSGIFVRRTAYQESGGFRPLPLFEDLDLLRRMLQYSQGAALTDLSRATAACARTTSSASRRIASFSAGTPDCARTMPRTIAATWRT